MTSTTSPNELKLSQPGEINVFFIGLPPYHDLAISQGWDPAEVDQGVLKDATAMLEAGYNIYIVAAGPEIPIPIIADKMRSKNVVWHATGVGMGVRASEVPIVVHFFEDLLHVFHKEAPEAYPIFNYAGPGSSLAAVQRRWPLENPERKAGKFLGYEVLFDGYKGIEWPLK